MDPELILRWKHYIENSGLNVTTLSEQIGKSRGYLSGLFSAAQRNPSKMPEPSAHTVLALARALNIPVSQLLEGDKSVVVSCLDGYHRELYQQSSKVFGDVLNMMHVMLAAKGVRPGVEEVLGWWRGTGGQMTDATKISESFDLIEIPDANANTVVPARVGKLSLAAQTLGEPNTGLLTRLVNHLPATAKIDLAKSYYEAGQSETPIFSPPLMISLTPKGGKQPIDVHFIRLQLRVLSVDGTPFIGSYCFPI